MAKATTSSLLAGLSGQVGPVQVCGSDGASIVKIMPKATKKDPTQTQVDQRLIFKMVIDFVAQTQKVMRIGYQAYTGAEKPLAAASSYHLKNSITGVSPTFKIDLTKVVVTKKGGGLQEDHTAVATMAAGALYNIAWDPIGGFDADDLVVRNLDKAVLLIVDETKGISYTSAGGTTRVAGALSVKLPRVFVGDTLHGYFFFAASNGKVSNSQYLPAAVLLA